MTPPPARGGGAVLATVGPDGSVSRERRVVAVSDVHEVDVSLDDVDHADDVRARVEAALAPLGGCVRVTLGGEVAPSVALDLGALGSLAPHLDGLVIRTGALRVAYDLEAIAAEATIRGQFVRLAQGEIPDPDQQRRVIVTGLRALDGRRDLEVA